MDKESSVPSLKKILMFPWLAYGHISPFLELSKKLTHRGFIIYLCSTSVNLNSVKKKIPENYFPSIQLVEIHLPNSSELPPSLHTTNGLPPHLMSNLKWALHKSKPELSKILKNLNPDLVIYDIVQTWTAALCSRHNIPAIKFSTSSAAMLSYFCHMGRKPGIDFPFPAIYLTDYELAKASKSMESARKDIADEDPEDQLPNRDCDRIILIKTCREIDGKYVDYLSDLFNWKVFPVCPLLGSAPVLEDSQEDDNNELIQWLGEKTENSSVFVSFGSEYFLNKEEIEEIALGLELSQVNFIWVLRFPKGNETKIEEILPKGFQGRVKNRGKIVQNWAPQAKILAHSSIGGFVCHCGWNSVLESIEIGVPIIAMPMNLDQPLNSRLIVELGVGVEIRRDDENGRIKREKIAEVIQDVIMGETGEKLRIKASDVGKKLKDREEKDLDEIVDIIREVCHENINN